MLHVFAYLDVLLFETYLGLFLAFKTYFLIFWAFFINLLSKQQSIVVLYFKGILIATCRPTTEEEMTN